MFISGGAWCNLMFNVNWLAGGLLLALFWFLLVGSDVSSLLIGVPFIALALFSSLWLSEARDETEAPKVQLFQLPGFIWFFLVNSIKGGVATAKLAFSPTPALSPKFMFYSLRSIRHGQPMQIFVSLISLLPGSVCVIQQPDGVLVHVLTDSTNINQELRECELAVCRLFGIKASKAGEPA